MATTLGLWKQYTLKHIILNEELRTDDFSEFLEDETTMANFKIFNEKWKYHKKFSQTLLSITNTLNLIPKRKEGKLGKN